ncbi:MAG: hypothetical protein ACE5DI_03475 [Candidatus Micrarchaeia archaeon]
MKNLEKNKILLTIVGLIFLAGLVTAQECELAIPRYGVIQCVSLGANEQPTTSITCTAAGECSTQFSCVSQCKLTKVDLTCDDILRQLFWDISISAGPHGQSTTISRDPINNRNPNTDLSFYYGQTVTLNAYCRDLSGKTKPISIAKSSFQVSQLRTDLKEGWAGTLPDVPLNAEGCKVTNIVGNYNTNTDVSSYLDPDTNTLISKPTSTYTLLQSSPVNWDIGQNYVFVKDWQTGIAGISLTYDKNKNAYWCGGTVGNRKIYAVNIITSSSGACYSVPTQIALENIQCCTPTDCLGIDATGKLTCNPDTWKCEETKPCNSDLECQQTFSSGVCSNKQLIDWRCDTDVLRGLKATGS